MEKKQYKYLEIFRAILCIAVLLYHLDLLQGGFLAVCCFFVLSGYLSTTSLLRREKVDLIKHYTSRFKKVYVPLLIVVLCTIAMVCAQSDIVWVSLKPETTSVLLGYNNFWQIEANLDYFARHTNSPFTHLWYMAILLQFELVYPIVFVVLNKIKKISKYLPSIISGILTIGFTVWFYQYSQTAPISAVYYNTFARIFSLLIGVNLGFMKDLFVIEFFKKNNRAAIFYFITFVLIIYQFFTLSADSEWFALSMIITSILSCVIILSAIAIENNEYNLFDKVFKLIALISYEIYLVQYPVIYLYELSSLNSDVYSNAVMISIITVGISILIHYVLSKKTTKVKLRLVLSSLVLFVSLFGGYEYIIAKDHTEEMKQLEADLAAQAEEMEKQNDEYAEKLKQENDAWEELLAQLEPDEEMIKESVSRLPVVFIGDSVMLGSASKIKSVFTNGYVDAKVSRTGYVMPDILKKLKIKGPVVIHAGTNGDCPESIKKKIMEYCGDNDVFWITVTNDKDVRVNDKLKKFVDKYDNAYLIDWQQYSKGQTDWFIGDRIHLQSKGQKEYASLIFESIYQVKLQQLEKQRDEAIAQRENELKKKYSFYGNDLLLGVYGQLNAGSMDANFVADKEMNAEGLLKQLETAIEQGALHYNVVLMLDATFELNSDVLDKIKTICQDKEVYVFTTVTYDGLIDDSVYSFETILNQFPEYYSPDRVRLNELGNDELYKFIVEVLLND